MYNRHVILPWPHKQLLKINDLTNCCANRLAHQGLKKGGKLGIMMHNSIAFVHSWIAASKLGVIYVPINTDYKGDILQYQLNKADVSHLIVDASLAARVLDPFCNAAVELGEIRC